MRKSMTLIFTAALTLALSFAQSTEAAKTGVISSAELKKVLPTDFFFAGQVAPVQARNAGGIRFAGNKVLVTALVDTSGYSSNVAEKYQGMLITEAAVTIAGTALPAGVYGFGSSADGKFNVMNIGGDQVLTVATSSDSAIVHPVPLMMRQDGERYRLYLGRKFVTIARGK